jgi:hypothetical protein
MIHTLSVYVNGFNPLKNTIGARQAIREESPKGKARLEA